MLVVRAEKKQNIQTTLNATVIAFSIQDFVCESSSPLSLRIPFGVEQKSTTVMLNSL
jgi:hypothetical protein